MCARATIRTNIGRAIVCVLSLAAGAAISATHARCEEPATQQPEWIEIKSTGDRAVRAMVAHPQIETPRAVVIILHEDRGLTVWERRLADQLSAAGYLAIAPDLLSDIAGKGSGTDSFETVAAARAAIYDIKPELVVADLNAVVAYTGNLPGGDKRVVVVGYGWGGSQAFHYAAHNRDVAATAVFYGAAPTADQMKQIQSPVFAFYAENDTRITGEVTKVRGLMTDAGRDFDALTYAGADHGFFRTGEAKDASPADRKARSEAWSRLTEILNGTETR